MDKKSVASLKNEAVESWDCVLVQW